MNDNDLLALCVLQEAGAELDDGKAAVARVIKNRIAAKYQSDGTMVGTVLKKDQFSWAWFAYDQGGYHRIAFDPSGALLVAQKKLAAAPAAALARCGAIAQDVMLGVYHGTFYDMLTDDAVMYLNPRVVVHQPAWAIPGKKVCTIGHHDFYRA